VHVREDKSVGKVGCLIVDLNAARYEVDQCRKSIAAISKVVGQKKKAGENADAEIAESLKLAGKLKELEELEDQKKRAVDAKLYLVGNLVHQSVPVSNNEENNRVERAWGERRMDKTGLKHHHELLWMIGGYEPEKGMSRTKSHRKRTFFKKNLSPI